jgi:hypothetical protein
MRRIFSFALTGFAASAMFSTAVLAGGPNVADYPLRVHIVGNNNRTHYHERVLDYVDGDGRANLFENSQPRGFDYAFRCNDRIRNSPGYETYPARWKKVNGVLEILQPVMGKPGAVWGCELKVEMKDIVYVRHNGLVDAEPAAKYKEWMDKRQYDPEHGKDQPASAGDDQMPDAPATAAPPQPAPPQAATGTASPQ